MKVAIIGSRRYHSLQLVRAYVASLNEDDWVVTGGAMGVDLEAEGAARERKLPFLVFPAQWERYGRSAGYKRNILIVQYADRVVAFWDGKSKGTQNTIELAERMDKPVEIVR